MNQITRVCAFSIVLLIIASMLFLALIKTNTVAPPAAAPRTVHKAYSTLQQGEWKTCQVSGVEYGQHEAYRVPTPGLRSDKKNIEIVYKEVESIIDAMVLDQSPMTLEEARRRWQVLHPSENSDG